MTTNKTARPRNPSDDLLDCAEKATAKWTRQKKSEERHPGNVRYRFSRMTSEPRTTQKAAWEEIAIDVHLKVSGPRNLPAKARQMFYGARPKIMAATDDKELVYGYFSQVLLPDYAEEHPKETKRWRIIYDARGHLEEPHTNRRIGVGTLEIDDYLNAMMDPKIIPADFSNASIETIGPSGAIAGILFCEKEGFSPLWKAVDLANRYDLMIISTKGMSVVAARKLSDKLCGIVNARGIPLFPLVDFDFDAFKIRGTASRDTRRYQFENKIEVVDLGLRMEDIAGLESEPAAGTKKMKEEERIAQLRTNGATEEEIEFLLTERVELNAMGSEELVEMMERKLKAYGLKKVIPDDDLLARAYREFHRSQELKQEFEELVEDFEATEIKVPKTLRKQVSAVLKKHPGFRWDEAVQVVLDENRLDEIKENKQKAREKSGDFSVTDDDEGE
jgi:hypothetical protein